MRVADLEPGVESGLLPLGQGLGPVPEQTADLVERVMLVTASTKLLLLDAAAYLGAGARWDSDPPQTFEECLRQLPPGTKVVTQTGRVVHPQEN